MNYGSSCHCHHTTQQCVAVACYYDTEIDRILMGMNFDSMFIGHIFTLIYVHVYSSYPITIDK